MTQAKKILILVGLLKNRHSAKITEIEGKIPSISGLATNSALTAVENKTPDISKLAKKTKTKQIIIQTLKKSKIKSLIITMTYMLYITTSEFNNLTAKSFAARLT